MVSGVALAAEPAPPGGSDIQGGKLEAGQDGFGGGVVAEGLA